MAHARRKFVDVYKSDKSPLANEALQWIAALYAIEATIRGRPAAARLAVRAEQSAPVFADLKGWMEQTLRRVSGKSDLAGAIRYTLSRWDALTLVLRDGRVCLDNNAAERAKLVKVPPAWQVEYQRRACGRSRWDATIGCSPDRTPGENVPPPSIR